MVTLNSTHEVKNLSVFKLVSSRRGEIADVSCNEGGIVFRDIKAIERNNIVWIRCGNAPGAVSVYNSSLVLRSGNFELSTTHGLAMYHSSVFIYSVIFRNGKGGGMYVSDSNLTLSGYLFFANNYASIGGAIYFTGNSQLQLINAKTSFQSNRADVYGGAIYADVTSSPFDSQPQLVKTFNESHVSFFSNFASTTGHSWYFEVNTTCNYTKNVSDPNSLLYYPKMFLYGNGQDISSTLYQLKLLFPAKCINDYSNEVCTEYELIDIMLGQEIIVPAKVLGYNDNIARPTQVVVACSVCGDKVFTYGNTVVIVHSDSNIRGIRIPGEENLGSNVTLKLTTISNQSLSVYLTVKLSPCFAGFHFVGITNDLGGCTCYEHKDIIKCYNDSTAQIKQGYWVGKVNDAYATTTCPTQYCDFSSCNDYRGYCHLPHSHDDQCKHHKTGPACGSCKPGYVLPFDSVDCVESSKCSAGITVLLVMLIIIYWFVTVAVIIVLMNFYHFQVGYAYGIIYFYSVMDVLVDDTSGWSVFQFTTILSGFAKMSPKFLGSLCFVGNKEWSGLDQQIIHYIHPIAVILILLVLSRAARCPIRLSQHIRRSIIHSICLILLLAYTSVASSSLELLRPLTFANVDGIYVYCSPNIGYFNGRHIAYGVIAILGSLLFVIGLPLLLLLEPLCLNRYLNLPRIKPLLDQYQACYKHKYRYFASYYLFC